MERTRLLLWFLLVRRTVDSTLTADLVRLGTDISRDDDDVLITTLSGAICIPVRTVLETVVAVRKL